MSVNLEQWISDHNIDEVECIVPDINGVQRGKVLPAKKFLSSVKDKSLRIPGSVFICTIDGHYPEDIDDIWDKDPDKILQIGRASGRERVWQVRVDLGGSRIIKKKKIQK